METVKFKVTVAYDGTRYAGWQTQKSGIGVQQVMEEALCQLFKSGGQLHSSSRTDTGVHALGMVAHVEISKAEFRMPVAKLALAWNAFLPEDIRVLSATRCGAAFHARFDARRKQYRYLIWNHRAMNPLLRFQAWHVPQPLDRHRMREAALRFQGRHDFRSFTASSGHEKKSTVRTVTRCEVSGRGPIIRVVIEGDGFLYKMCRGIVGTLVQVGRGRYTPGEVGHMFSARDRRVAGMTAPAHGLVLWKVFYASGRARSLRSECNSPVSGRKGRASGSQG